MARKLKAMQIPRLPDDDKAGAALDVSKAIAEFYADFPHHKSDIFILDHQKFKSGKEAVEDVAHLLDAHKQSVGEFKLGFNKMLAQGAFEGQLPCSVPIEKKNALQRETESVARFVVPAGPEFGARILKNFLGGGSEHGTVADYPAMPEKFNNTETWQRYVLDHELGHAITLTGRDKSDARNIFVTQYRECEADTYAMLRYMQRSDCDTGFVDYVSGLRTITAVHAGACTHLTSKALEVLVERVEGGEIDPMKLSPAECRLMAIKIAREVAYSPEAEHNLTEALEVSRTKRQDYAKEQAALGLKPVPQRAHFTFDEIVEVGATTKSPAVHETITRYLRVIRDYDHDGRLTNNRIHTAQMRVAGNNPDEAEPALPPHKKALRDMFLDASMGVTPDKTSNDNKVDAVRVDIRITPKNP